MKTDKGATAIEYTLIASLIAVAAIVAIGNVGTKVNGVLSNVASTMKSSELVGRAREGGHLRKKASALSNSGAAQVQPLAWLWQIGVTGGGDVGGGQLGSSLRSRRDVDGGEIVGGGGGLGVGGRGWIGSRRRR